MRAGSIPVSATKEKVVFDQKQAQEKIQKALLETLLAMSEKARIAVIKDFTKHV